MLGVRIFALPRLEPTIRPVNAPNRLVAVYDRATGVPIVAVAMVSGFGETVAPSIDAVMVNGALSASDDRRASTETSHTPGIGLLAVRVVASPVAQPA